MNLAQLIAPWHIPGPVTFRQIDIGFINAIFAVEAPSGRYVLRVYREPGDFSRIRHEHRVAIWLQQAGLSYAVPAPIPAADGETLAAVAGPEGVSYVALIPFLPGTHPDFRHLNQAEAAGAALGELVTALGALRPDAAILAVPSYCELTRIHAEIPNPPAVVDWLPVEPAWRHRIGRLLESALANVGSMYNRLPRQVIHGDLTHGNVLMEDDRVTGLLDFEFSAWDLRAMDYAVGIGGGPKSLRSGWGDWAVLESFSRGYFRHHRLTAEELEVLPDLIRLRRLNILLRFAGRYRQGLDPVSEVQGMAWWTLNAEDWLEASGAELVRRAQVWSDLYGRS
ncbi:MAG TPA: phosphotransferase [Symbiobacteriaceae bacterium]|jgi:homoserine kinase type II|nr:phosphotransferase [Symbiobacteriaceae bacterium]